MKVRAVICSIGCGEHAALLDTARPALEAWADHFGYALDLRYQSLDQSRPPAWSKVLLLRERIESHNRVIWIDADALVVDVRYDPTALVSRRRPIAMVAHHYGGMTVPNTGVLVLRSSRVVRRMLADIWAMDEFREHKWWENAAMLVLLGYDITHEPIVKARASRLERRVVWLDRAWNSIELDPAPDPIIVHFPGMANDERAIRMTEIADSFQRQSPRA